MSIPAAKTTSVRTFCSGVYEEGFVDSIFPTIAKLEKRVNKWCDCASACQNDKHTNQQQNYNHRQEPPFFALAEEFPKVG